MKIQFLGAAQDVTGSMHLIEVNGKRILLDCGLWQGKRALTYERNLHFPFDPAAIDVLVLSHAHIDHSGNIPNLVKQGFQGNIYCTQGTRNLSTYMLMDSGGIHEQDAEYVNKQRAKQGEPPIEPLYTRRDAEICLGRFISAGFENRIYLTDGVQLTFHVAGHILGAAWVSLDIDDHETGQKRRIIFSGDLGRSKSPLLRPPLPPDSADIVIMESTYGDKLHGTTDDAARRLRDVVNATARRRGNLIIPAFAVGRTQELVYALNRLDERGDIPELPIYVDSPLAVETTDVFRMAPEEWNDEVRAFLTQDHVRNPFDDANIRYVRDVADSKRLNNLKDPSIIISASGMAETGRILHHLKNNIGDPDNTILIVSYQAENTLGRRLKDHENPVRIFGVEYTVRAQVEVIDGLSAHADQGELMAWADALDRSRLQHLCLVHGEIGPATTFQRLLTDKGFSNVSVPARGDELTL